MEGVAGERRQNVIGRQFKETQFEITDYGFGRRSCDIDPRFSLDAGRISLDDPRYSFDEPRASWDGYLIGRTFPRMHNGLGCQELEKCNGACRRFWRFPAIRKKVEKEKKKKNTEGYKLATGIVEKRREKKKKEKGGERKYNCLKSREGIVNVKYEIILFIMLTFLLK